MIAAAGIGNWTLGLATLETGNHRAAEGRDEARASGGPGFVRAARETISLARAGENRGAF